MNIIFLDMDGVLNSSEVYLNWIKQNGKTKEAISTFKHKYCLNENGPYYYYIVPELLERFKRLYSQIPNCKVVWSSSWRRTAGKNSKLFVGNLYYWCGLPEESFLDYTPHIPYALRYNEIQEWIDTHKDIYQIEKCAILDDLEEANPMQEYCQNIPIKFFLISEKTGLTENDVQNILDFFEHKGELNEI